MVVLEQDEYCFLYDWPSFPELLENLLEFPAKEDASDGRGLNSDQAREIFRELIGRVHQEV